MKTGRDSLQHIANLAKLKFTEEEIDKLSAVVDKILEHFRDTCTYNLGELDFDLEPGQKVTFREDKVKKFESREELLQNAKQMREGFIVVPKVLE